MNLNTENLLNRFQARYIFRQFVRLQASSGIILIALTVLALLLANLAATSDSYFSIWETKATIGYGEWALSKPLLLWINDGLMAIFFFVVGLEIKREFLAGQLSTPRQAALPFMAAIGGMLVPAALYVLVNGTGPGSHGWGVPMATDIAFTLGILGLFGKRIPLSLKVFITSLAIVDDIGAVMVIALFYSGPLALTPALIAVGLVLAAFGMNRMNVKQPLPYALIGIGVWVALLLSGLHATIAGVLLAFTIPAQTWVNVEEFRNRIKDTLKLIEPYDKGAEVLGDQKLQAALQQLEDASDRIESPLQRLEHQLHPWVTFAIVPIFALANAGVLLTHVELPGAILEPVSLGIILGLVIGKPLGISLFAWMAVKLGIAELPRRINWQQIIAISFLAGIGFTMSIFVGTLAFADEALLTASKMGIITASLLAGILGAVLLQRALRRPVTEPSFVPDASLDTATLDPVLD